MKIISSFSMRRDIIKTRVDVRQAVMKIIAKSLSQHDEKHVGMSPLSSIRVGRKRYTYANKKYTQKNFGDWIEW
jgi:hypothetical protein